MSTDELYKMYQGLKLSSAYIKRHLHVMHDLFSLPEATLLADVCGAGCSRGFRLVRRRVFGLYCHDERLSSKGMLVTFECLAVVIKA